MHIYLYIYLSVNWKKNEIIRAMTTDIAAI
jgi:hypothetical protein